MFLIPTRPPFGNWGQSPQTPLPGGRQAARGENLYLDSPFGPHGV